MACKIAVFVLLVLFCIITGTSGQCIPNPVGELNLTNGHLYWDPSENCPNTIYRVYIGLNGSKQFDNNLQILDMSVDFLRYCLVYNFTITPISNHIVGMESYLVSYFGLPANSDIAVLSVRASMIDDDVLITWSVMFKYYNCVNFYHLVVYDNQLEQPESLQVNQSLSPGYLLEHVPRCADYRFEVTSHYDEVYGTSQNLNYVVPAVTNTPTLVAVRQDAVTINTTWSLEKYYQNRCPITFLYVNGTRFNATYSVDDVPERPNFEVSITGLRANSMYYFNVSVENSAGISEAYQMAVQTLPIDASLE